MIDSHSGNAGIPFSFNSGHLGLKGSEAFTLHELLSNSLSAREKTLKVRPPLRNQLQVHTNHNFPHMINTRTLFSLTFKIFGEISKYNEVGLINSPTEDPVKPILIMDEDALFGNTVRHNPDTQHKHEEEHIHHLEYSITSHGRQKDRKRLNCSYTQYIKIQIIKQRETYIKDLIF